MKQIVDLFGHPTSDETADWNKIATEQQCPFLGRACWKSRKSEPEIKIGTCTVEHGASPQPIMICPDRLIDQNKIFVDCLHLLTRHRPGNDYHLVRELKIPGGSVDYVLASATAEGNVVDFVGIELQTLDTTGTVWPTRQKFLAERGVDVVEPEEWKTYNMNWKMTAKTILVQMHHKAKTFSNVNRHLVLVVQEPLLEYIRKSFNIEHFDNPPVSEDTVHFHSYRFGEQVDNKVAPLVLNSRLSTDVAGIQKSLGLKTDAVVEESVLFGRVAAKISAETKFIPV